MWFWFSSWVFYVYNGFALCNFCISSKSYTSLLAKFILFCLISISCDRNSCHVLFLYIDVFYSSVDNHNDDYRQIPVNYICDSRTVLIDVIRDLCIFFYPCFTAHWNVNIYFAINFFNIPTTACMCYDVFDFFCEINHIYDIYIMLSITPRNAWTSEYNPRILMYSRVPL